MVLNNDGGNKKNNKRATFVVDAVLDDQKPLLQATGNKMSTNSGNGFSIFRRTNSECSEDDARKMLKTRAGMMLTRGDGSKTTQMTHRHLVKQANIENIIFPWIPAYKIWWGVTAAAAIVTAFFVPFRVAFFDDEGHGNNNNISLSKLLEMTLTAIFALDIGVNFNLAFYKDELLVFERSEICKDYLSGMFWVDFIGVIPFEPVALFILSAVTSNPNQHHQKVLFLSLLRLIRFVRLHRMKKLSEILQYNPRISLIWFTLLRNLAAVLFATHSAACTMYFLARIHNFDETTWLGSQQQQQQQVMMTITMDMTDDGTGTTTSSSISAKSALERYITALYWSVVTFCTVGYGDLTPVNTMEQTACIVFMLFYIVVAAWIIGSITLLVVKGDEKTGEYRDVLQTLHQYSQIHDFDQAFEDSLLNQLRLEFDNREIADEQILKHFPSAVRRKILRKLYYKPLFNTQLMKGIRERFVDAFLASCTVEIFSPGEVIVERGSIVSDLFLLVGGVAEIAPIHYYGSDDGSNSAGVPTGRSPKLEAGEFIGEIGFFTESPQVDTVTCLTVCKTLAMSQASYKLLAHDHPGSVGKILKNLLTKVEKMELELPKDLSVLRLGSIFDMEGGYGSLALEDPHEMEYITSSVVHSRREAVTAIRDLVKMHMSKQLDDQTTRFCFAASRGDTSTIALMCDQGFDPNNVDYDNRTALMVASMKGNKDVVKMLLEYKANPNLTDMHGSTALLEAVKNGHQDTMKVLFAYGAKLCMSESLAASVLCQAVFDGDILLLKRLLDANIQVDAADYDKRTAAHIAAAEGNVAAIRVLAERGADLTLQDRWGNTVQQEAERSNARGLLEFLEKCKYAFV